MKILVTGASGYLGGHVAARLARDGHSVVAQGGNRAPAPNPGIQTFTTGPLERFTQWDTLLKGVDTVVHVAGRAHVLVRASANVETALFDAANEVGTMKLLDAMARRGIGRLIHISSIAAKAPVDPYSHSKRKGEIVVERWAEAAGREAIIVRPPILYGPGAPGNMARLAKLIVPGVPLPFGSLDNRRSLLSAENAADAVAAALQREQTLHTGIYEICDERPLSLPNMLRALARGMDRRLLLLPVPVSLLYRLVALRSPKVAESLFGDLVLDNTTFSQRFGWSPRVDSHDGLVEMGRSLKR